MENIKKNVKLVNLRAFRLMNELSQKEVAEYLEVSIAFISAIERGQARLPAEKLVRLLENDRDWATDTLIEGPERGTRIHHDHRSIGQNIEGEFNAPFHNNNYSGFSDEEFERELSRRLELKDQQIASLEAEVTSLRKQLDREISRNERLMAILEKGSMQPTGASGEVESK